MKVIGFNYTKINVEKFSDISKELKINTNIDISDINEVKTELFKSNEDFLGIKFNFNIDYDPDYAKITLSGVVLLEIDAKMSKEVLKQWKDKKMPEEFRIPLFNLILRKSSIKAIELEDEMNLPLHINLPILKKQEETN